MAEQSPQQLAEEGKRLYQRGDHKTAAGTFATAAEAYQAQGDALTAAEMKNNQCVALLQAKNYAAALDAVNSTEKIFAEAGDLRRQGIALANQAAVLDALKRKDEAIKLYQQAASVLAQAGEDQMRADVLRSLAALQARRGKFADMVYAEQDGLLGVNKPTLKQRILKALMLFVFWKWKRK